MRCAIIGAMLLYALQVCVGIGWGVPTSDIDPFLFPDQTAWSGEQIAALVGESGRIDPATAADVDVNPLAHDELITLNDSDRQTAEILRRYRLFTHQPDEMITMMALSGMNPRKLQLDPKLYQYGGLFIYPVGATIAAGGVLGLIPVKSQTTYYLDHPDAFGRFYIAARLYAAAWGLLAIVAVHGIGYMLAGRSAAITAAYLFAILPIVVCMSHEAKPHLPGAALMLAAVWCGMKALTLQRTRDWAGLFVCCGAAVGMVLSAAPIVILIPLIVGMHCRQQHLRQIHEKTSCRRLVNYKPVFVRATAGGLLVAGAVYLVTNPYIVINLFANRDVLRSNFGNSLAMYEIARLQEGAWRVLQLTIEGATLPVVILGLIALIAAIRGRHLMALPLAVPAAALLLQFILIGAGKPDEYGRFGVFHNTALVIGAACAFAASAPRTRLGSALCLAVTLALCVRSSGGYLWSAHADATRQGSRTLAAGFLANRIDRLSPEQRRIAVVAEPAPYACPPVSFASTSIVLFRTDGEDAADNVQTWLDAQDVPTILVTTADNPEQLVESLRIHESVRTHVLESRARWLPRSPISWANKPVVVFVRGP